MSKRHITSFSQKKKAARIERPKVSLKIDGQCLEEVVKTKFLGVIIDNQLTWKEHVNLICGKIARDIGILLKSRHFVYRNTLTTLYYSFVYPYFTYCNHIWGSSTSANLKRLYALQKKVIRIIFNVKPKQENEPKSKSKKKEKISTESMFKKIEIVKCLADQQISDWSIHV